MKTATAFLVAVTVFASVFLESSAAPNTFLSDIALKVGGTVSGVTKVVAGAITGAGEATSTVLAKTGENLEDVIKAVVNKATADIKTVIQVADNILNALVATLGKVTKAVAALGGEISEKLNAGLITLQSDIKELIKLAEKIPIAVAEGTDGTVKELDGLFKIVVAKLKADVAVVTEILDKISGKAGSDVALIIQTVKGTLVKVNEEVEVIITKVAEALKSKTEKTEVVKEYVEKAIKISEEDLAAFWDFVEGYLAKISDEEKESLAKLVEWLKEFDPLVYGIHKEIREAVKDNDRKKLEKVIEKILEVIKTTKEQVNEFLKTLKVDEIKEAIIKFILGIVTNGEKVVIVLKKQMV